MNAARRPLKVLVVEDEMTVALMIEDMLVELGHEVVALTMRLQPALLAAEEAEIDFAILDINLDGRLSFPVADILARRGIRFAFASGYGEAGLAAGHQQRPVVRKPFQIKDIESAIALALA
jgi:CheY-like chemotaxis protein